MKSVYHPFYLVLRAALKIPVRFFFAVKGFRVSGGNHLPKRRIPAMIICNHAAFIDSVYLVAAMRPRFVICGAKPRYFEKKAMRFVMKTATIMKIESEAQFIGECTRLLRSGEPVLVYPEMGRYPEGMGPFKTWAAKAAIAAGAVAVPCYLWGTTKGQSGPKRLFVGAPIPPSGSPESLTQVYRRAVEGLMPAQGGLP